VQLSIIHIKNMHSYTNKPMIPLMC